MLIIKIYYFYMFKYIIQNSYYIQSETFINEQLYFLY